MNPDPADLSVTTSGTNSTNGATLTGLKVRVGVWSLQAANKAVDPSPPESTDPIVSLRPGTESVIGRDDRVLVKKKDYMPGGKYQSIVKLFLHFKEQNQDDPWAMATGWLIRPDLVVTAGHCAYDWSHDLGQIVDVKAYIGYAGSESIDNPDFAVQMRAVTTVATTYDWLNNGTNEARDVSFFQLSSPFTTITPISYSQTPLQGDEVLGVVGYPGDLMSPATGEKAAYMYEMYLGTVFDLTKRNSGSPVFQKSNMKAIGVHVFGGNPNSASAIAGIYGNPFDAYVAALDAYSKDSFDANITKQKAFGKSWLSYVDVPLSSVVPINGNTPSQIPVNGPGKGGGEAFTPSLNPSNGSGQPQELEEGFLDFLKKGLSIAGPIASTVLNTALPITLGPLGVPVAALAGVAINAAGKLAGSSTGTEADVGKEYSFDGVAERAILGEAAIAALIHLGPDKAQEEGLFSTMQDVFKKLGPVVTQAAPKVLGVLAEPALRIALDSIHKSESGTESTLVVAPIRGVRRGDTNTVGFGPRLDANKEAFIKGLHDSLTEGDAEGFLDVLSTVGDVISKGMRVAVPIISSVAKVGLPLLLGGAEADIDPANAFAFDGYAQRALVGEAALQAISQMPADKLQEEGLFDVMKSVIAKVGPMVIKSAPGLIAAVKPLVGNLINQKGGGDSFTDGKSNVPKSIVKAPSTEADFVNRLKPKAGTEFLGPAFVWPHITANDFQIRAATLRTAVFRKNVALLNANNPFQQLYLPARSIISTAATAYGQVLENRQIQQDIFHVFDDGSHDWAWIQGIAPGGTFPPNVANNPAAPEFPRLFIESISNADIQSMGGRVTFGGQANFTVVLDGNDWINVVRDLFAIYTRNVLVTYIAGMTAAQTLALW